MTTSKACTRYKPRFDLRQPTRRGARRAANQLWLLRNLLLIAATCVLSGCSTLSWYTHLAAGEVRVLAQRQSIARLIADPRTDAELRRRLQLAARARAFASDVLELPRNRSYTTYADIGRPYVMYNVFATPPLSLHPLQHCFPIAGCVAYQGFYQHRRAQATAEKLREAGNDVYVGGVTAYSTLGHFADPLLSSMNHWSDDELVGTLFHELAHQKIYVKGNTTFNESFATFVEREGLRQWHAAMHITPSDPDAATRQRQFTQLILAIRARLTRIYASDLPNADKARRKQQEFARLREQYRKLRDQQWHGNHALDAWFNAPLNNAKLLPFGLYDDAVPAFAALFAAGGGHWARFYAKVRALSRLPPAQRQQVLQAPVDEEAGKR